MKDNIYNKELVKKMLLSLAYGNRTLEGFEDTKEKRDCLLMVSNAKEPGKEVTEEKKTELVQTLKSGTQEEKGTIILDILDHYKITDEVKEVLRTEMQLVKSIRNTYCYPGAEI